MRLTRTDGVRLLLLWLGGIDIRLTMLAVPPLVPLIHRDLHLDEKAVGALVSGPVLLLAIAAVPGSLLIAKLGVRGALLAGLATVAVFGALRGYGPSVPILFSATFLMGVGVAVSQPAFPALVREWFPRRRLRPWLIVFGPGHAELWHSDCPPKMRLCGWSGH